ncbi:MAG: nuclear transport factor 2 family protein [SAR86 cluster bacterium]|jgi:3-phenylpropionate/cinnamic acid dioxygenase small subunit|nr:nuclear transport factor 2 family protein [SAR86 cluster bacterium]|tara:strand:- start:1347 stop:1811 length:465 start_codon:yes stop_codon:yes gene_type:complete
MDPSIKNILARASIEEQIYAYAIALDDKNWEELKLVFTEDAETSYGSKDSDTPFKCKNRKEIIKMCEEGLSDVGVTQHLFSNLRIKVMGDRAISESSALIQHASKDSNETKSYEMWGEYTDEWVLIDDTWKIKNRELIVLKEFGNISIEELNED